MYSDPTVYDILHTPGTSEEVDTYQRIVSIHLQLNKSIKWLEPACGTGRCLRLLAARGYYVAGFDIDPEMIRYCKNSGLDCELFEADMIDFNSQLQCKFDVAFNPFNSIRHLHSDDAMVVHLEQVAQSLNSGGLYLVGISLSDYDNDVPEEDIWTGSRDDCKVTQVVNYLPPDQISRLETVISHILVENSDEHINETYKLRSYDKNEWAEVIANSPFEIVGSYDLLGITAGNRKLIYQIEVLRTI
ncbi:MAG: class I SAM-dependent methyltransferase [bacterium]|nr:class I SAM-dependent methyltransferase [bacterium]MCP4800439.1 class I SAM-dependent methyltransferase [bacterium]